MKLRIWMPIWIGCLLLGGVLASLVPGCTTLAPGADPLVVRVEQTETDAKALFDMALAIDNSNRGFWKTNVPAYHSFCEWLRQPQTVEVTNTLPRGAAMLISLDDVKLDYKAARASSNTLWTIYATVLSAENQASSWITITTNGISLPK